MKSLKFPGYFSDVVELLEFLGKFRSITNFDPASFSETLREPWGAVGALRGCTEISEASVIALKSGTLECVCSTFLFLTFERIFANSRWFGEEVAGDIHLTDLTPGTLVGETIGLIHGSEIF